MTSIQMTRFCPLFLLEGMCALVITSLGLGFAFSSLTWAFIAASVHDAVRLILGFYPQRLVALT